MLSDKAQEETFLALLRCRLFFPVLEFSEKWFANLSLSELLLEVLDTKLTTSFSPKKYYFA